MMYKSLKNSAIQGNTKDETLEALDYSDDYNVAVGVSGTKYRVTVCAKGASFSTVDYIERPENGTGITGKFSNMDLTKYYNTSGTTGSLAKITSNIGSDYRLSKHCITSSYDTSTD